MVGGLFLWSALWYETGYVTVWATDASHHHKHHYCHHNHHHHRWRCSSWSHLSKNIRSPYRTLTGLLYVVKKWLIRSSENAEHLAVKMHKMHGIIKRSRSCYIAALINYQIISTTPCLNKNVPTVIFDRHRAEEKLSVLLLLYKSFSENYLLLIRVTFSELPKDRS